MSLDKTLELMILDDDGFVISDLKASIKGKGERIFTRCIRIDL